MKAGAGILLAGLLVIAAVLYVGKDQRFSAPEESEPLEVSETPPSTMPEPSSITLLPVAQTAALLNSPKTTVQDDISTLDLVFSQYRKLDGGNPVGANDEITAALLGKNARSLGFIEAASAPLDSWGQLLDRWGTPYFFHAISGERMEIISAGPDLRLHTEDDVKSE